jgi:hypothetical protein
VGHQICTLNCHYFNCNDLGKCKLSQTGTLDCFLYVILYDFRCRMEPVTFGIPDNGGLTTETHRGNTDTNI